MCIDDTLLCAPSPGRSKRQFPPVGPPLPGVEGTLPPGLHIPCICCQTCQDDQCSAALPGHVCVEERIAQQDMVVDFGNCQTGRCTPLAGQGPCLCCPIRNSTTTIPATTTTPTTSTTPTTTAMSSTATTTPTTTTNIFTGQTPVEISLTTTVPTTTTSMIPTTTTATPTCPKSTCCSATFLQGGTCIETRLLSKNIKNKFCSKTKS